MTSENEINIFEFNELMNNAQIIYHKTERKFFVDVRKIGNVVLFHYIRFYCRECDKTRGEECENVNMSTILEIIETMLHKQLVINSKRIIDSTCETNYFYIFIAK